MFVHADSEDSDQTRRKPRLICVFDWREGQFCWFCHEAAHIFFAHFLSLSFVTHNCK